MQMVSYADFVPEISLAVGDIPPPVAENYVRQACIAFCEQSQVLVRRVTIDTQACVTDYPIQLPTCERIVSIQRVCSGGRCGTVSGTALTHDPCELHGCTVHGSSVWLVPPDTLSLRPAPSTDQEAALWVEVAVAPLRDSCDADALLYERYHETIIDGTLARLYAAKTTPWHDRALAEYHRTLFNNGVAAAGLDRLTGGARGPFRFKPRRIV